MYATASDKSIIRAIDDIEPKAAGSLAQYHETLASHFQQVADRYKRSHNAPEPYEVLRDDILIASYIQAGKSLSETQTALSCKMDPALIPPLYKSQREAIKTRARQTRNARLMKDYRAGIKTAIIARRHGISKRSVQRALSRCILNEIGPGRVKNRNRLKK